MGASCPLSVRTLWPVAAFQRCTRRSWPAVAISRPSGENTARSTLPSCGNKWVKRQFLVSQSHAAFSARVAKKSVPSGENSHLACCRTPSRRSLPPPLKRRTNSPFATFQICAVLSSLAVATYRPSGEKTASDTGAECPRRTWMAMPPFTSQIRAVPSSPLVAIH